MALTTNLVSYWKLDESSGNASDSVGGNTLTNSNVTYSAGKINNGASSNGSSSLFTLSSVPVTGNSSFTVSFWLKITALPGTGITYNLWRWGSAGSKQTAGLFYQENSGVYKFDYGVSFSDLFYNTTLSTGTWYYITTVYDGSNQYFYINASQVASSAQSSINIGTTFGYIISDNATNVLNGMMDEIGVWSRALSGSEITSLYNGGTGLQYPFTTANTSLGFFSMI